MLVHDDGPRALWRLAVVEDLIHGGDGLVRAANIRTSTGRTNRPIVRLIPLEVSAQDKDSVCSDSSGLSCRDKGANSMNDIQVDVSGDVESRPVRSSARRARERLTQWADILSGPPEDVMNC